MNVEEIHLRILDAPEDHEIDIDNVFISGQHEAFFRHPERPAIGPACAHADLDDVLSRHLREMHLLDRIRKTEMQAGRFLAARLSQVQDDAELIGINAEGESKKRNDRRQYDGHQKENGQRSLSRRA